MERSNHQITESVVKTLFSLVPFAGQALNETFYDFRGRIKQERLNDFSALLSQYFDQHGSFEFKDLNAVEFSDLFESVIQRVARTGSGEKQRRFRDILVGYLENPGRDLDHSDTFLELVSTLNEPAIQILKYYNDVDDRFLPLKTELQEIDAKIADNRFKLDQNEALREKGDSGLAVRLYSEYSELDKERSKIKDLEYGLVMEGTAELFGLSIYDFLYLKQILTSRALMIDAGIGSINHEPFLDMRITFFGKQFISYIKESV